ncbi:MAG: fused response regulator/phosphatase [SAR324 cluster bacterium]|nr:fused response regulator/phosphatase [SAR324 cluster bacterium]
MPEQPRYCLLIIDDSQFVRMVIKQAFQPLSCVFTFLEASNGQEGLQIAKKEEIDLIITDMEMPVMDGLMFIRELRTTLGNTSVPVLFLTGITDNNSKIQAFELGATDYVTKPFIIQELKARTMGYLERHRSMQDLRLEIMARNMAEEALSSSYSTIKGQKLEMEEDLQMAEDVQKKLITSYKPPTFLDIVVQYNPQSHVSGDIYYLKEGHNGYYNMFVGDGTGHGVAAALSTIMAKMLLDQSIDSPNIEDVFKHVNQTFEEEMPDDRFISAICARINSEGELSTANAGHPSLIIIPADGQPPVLLNLKGKLLGLFPNDWISYTEERYTMKKGDRGFLYTDGVNEAKDGEDNLFGEERLCDFLARYRELPLKSLVKNLVKELDEFTFGTYDDDVTVIAFEYLGNI